MRLSSPLIPSGHSHTMPRGSGGMAFESKPASQRTVPSAVWEHAKIPQFWGLLRPSMDGRRRPLLGMRSLQHAAELAPFAAHLASHLATSAVLCRSAEVDVPLLELLLGVEYLSEEHALAMLAPHMMEPNDGSCTSVGAASGSSG